MVKEAQQYVANKMSNPRLRGDSDGAVFSHEGTDLATDIYRTKEGRFLRMVAHIDNNVRGRIRVEQRAPYRGDTPVLGRGGSATVKLAEELRGEDGNRYVALKTLNVADRTRKTELADREYRMTRKAPKVKHFSEIRDLMKFGDEAHLIMDLTVRGDLIDLLEKLHDSTRVTQPQRDKLLRTIALHAMTTVKLMHDARIYHQDVKPDNMLLSKNGALVMTDFATASTNEQGITAGTREYLPPEASVSGATGKKSDSDKYALGRMLAHAAANQGGGSEAAQALQQIGAQLSDPNPLLRPSLEALLDSPYFKGEVYSDEDLLRVVDNL
jgi:serine/threonine protein kinase